jgi:hypothetical protein
MARRRPRIEALYRDVMEARRDRGASPLSRLRPWVNVIVLREALRGEMDVTDWERLQYGLIEAAKAGSPLWPVYARLKRGAA